MNRLSAKTRIVVGLIAILVSVLMIALVIGIVPDQAHAVMKGRARLCESIAVNSSVLVSRDDIRRLEAVLGALVKHNDEILSAAVRRKDGQVVVEVGGHAKYWQDVKHDQSLDTQVFVPIQAGDEKWGGVEVRFAPVQRRGVVGFLLSPWTRLVYFVSVVSFVLYSFYLGRMLQYLNPSKAVPGRVRSALDTLSEGLMVLDRQGRIVLANQAFADCIGRPSEKLLGLRASDLPWSSPNCQSKEKETVYPWLNAADDKSRNDGTVLQLATGESGVRTFVVNCSPIHGQSGKHRGVLVSLEDVTTLEDARVQLKISKDEAERANAAKSEFLARMSHEIRTPMNAILGFTDVLLRGYAESDTQRQEYLGTIHSSGTHLLDLINDILDLSKIEAGRLEVELVRCSPYSIASQVVSALRIRAEEKGITCGLSAATDIPETILTDPIRLRQVLTNLVGNAIKFTDTGGVKVVVRMDTSGGTPRLVIDVVDTGVGIPRNALEKIFDPFSQADATVTRKFGGTGLGLSISRRLVEALGGRITVESEPGEGSIFTASIDTGSLESVRVLSPQMISDELRADRSRDETVLQLPPGRILVADDGEANCRLISVVLHRAGVEVMTAHNGQVAVSLATEEYFDAVVMDMQMPVMDGYTATATLRQQGFSKPIIALTADAMDGSEGRCRAAGCSHFLTKPLDMDLLTATLNGILKKSTSPHSKSPPVNAQAVEEDKSIPSPAKGLCETPPPCSPSNAGQTAEKPSVAACIQDNTSRPTASQGNDAFNDRGPVTSSLPMDDAEFRMIVVGYVDRLREQLNAMRQAYERKEFVELAKLAHWLKGSAETVGFASFTAPAVELEQLAKDEQILAIGAQLDILHGLADRIVVPDVEQPELLAAT